MSEHLDPWHDTPKCLKCSGPIVSFSLERPQNVKDPCHVKCAACGNDYRELDPKILAQIYFAAGAWLGSQIIADRIHARYEAEREADHG